MLHCKYCDYYKQTANLQRQASNQLSYCELTNFNFEDDVENLNMDYPCDCRKG